MNLASTLPTMHHLQNLPAPLQTPGGNYPVPPKDQHSPHPAPTDTGSVERGRLSLRWGHGGGHALEENMVVPHQGGASVQSSGSGPGCLWPAQLRACTSPLRTPSPTPSPTSTESPWSASVPRGRSPTSPHPVPCPAKAPLWHARESCTTRSPRHPPPPPHPGNTHAHPSSSPPPAPLPMGHCRQA